MRLERMEQIENPKKTTAYFDKLLSDAIDEALNSLGNSAKIAIYFHLEADFGLPQKDIPCEIGYFSYAIGKIFGVAARRLEIMCMIRLQAKLNSECTWNNRDKWFQTVTFQEYALLKRLNFENKTRNRDSAVLLSLR
jgi:hypothetical protein